jgi:hypothetical protein
MLDELFTVQIVAPKGTFQNDSNRLPLGELHPSTTELVITIIVAKETAAETRRRNPAQLSLTP